MTTPQPHQQTPDPTQPGGPRDPGDQDIDTAGTEANPLPSETLAQFFLAELDREVDRSRRALEHIPADHGEWKPHDRSMAFGPLAYMVATIPSWIAMIAREDEHDIAPADGPTLRQDVPPTSPGLLRALEAAAAEARVALSGTNDDRLHTAWRLKVRGDVVQEAPRVQMIQDAFNHWAHHRGQMTVYLRLMGEPVPAIYGPSADDASFR